MSAVTTLRLPQRLLQRFRDEAAREHRTMAGEIAAEEAFAARDVEYMRLRARVQ
jgi:hypothetical protein